MEPTRPAKRSQDRDYAYYAKALAGRTYPAAFVELDVLRINAKSVAERAEGKPVRLASKSIRCRDILRRLLAESPLFRGIMCYNAREAAWLASDGFTDLLVAYPTVNEREIELICGALAGGSSISLTVDCIAQVQAISTIAQKRGVQVPLCIDVDMSTELPGLHFGVHRSPLHSAQDVVAFAEAISKFPNVRLEGALTYEAQIAGLPDKVPARVAMNAVISTLKSISVRELSRRRRAIVAALQEAQFSLRFVNGGGTGSLESTRKDTAVTELAAGSAFYSPGLFDGYSAFRHRPAAGFAVQIVRQPAPRIFTCHGGGYSASGAPGPDRLPKPFLPEGAALLSFEGAGEVQTPVKYDGALSLKIGDLIFFRHAKAGELCEHFDKLLLISEGRVVDEVQTYRGEGQCFL